MNVKTEQVVIIRLTEAETATLIEALFAMQNAGYAPHPIIKQLEDALDRR